MNDNGKNGKKKKGGDNKYAWIDKLMMDVQKVDLDFVSLLSADAVIECRYRCKVQIHFSNVGMRVETQGTRQRKNHESS